MAGKSAHHLHSTGADEENENDREGHEETLFFTGRAVVEQRSY